MLSPLEGLITKQDISKITNILTREWDNYPATDWRNLENLRICTFQEMLSMVVVMNIPKVLVNLKSKGEIYGKVLSRACEAYMRESSQCQLDTADTEIGKMALRAKLALPIGPFDGVDAAEPHPSWRGIIDSVDTPQSELSGAIVAIVDGVNTRKGDNGLLQFSKS